MFILFFHFLSFKLVNLIQVLIYGKEWYELATFPVLVTDGCWWILYTIIGIVVPLLVNAAWEKLKLLVGYIDRRTSKYGMT